MGKRGFLIQFFAAVAILGLMLSGSVVYAITGDAAQTADAARYADEDEGGCGGGGGGNQGCGGSDSVTTVTPPTKEQKLNELNAEKQKLEKTLQNLEGIQTSSFERLDAKGVTPAEYYESFKQAEQVKSEINKINAEIASLTTQTTIGTPAVGSCPYLYTWDGSSYVKDNDIIPFKYPERESMDYYRIQKPMIPDNGVYKVRILEELPETSYLDFIKLMTVDYPENVDIYPDLQGNIFNISDPKPPISCVDNNGSDCLGMLNGREEVYDPGTFFEGNAGDYVTVDFGDLSGAKMIKLVLTTDGLPDLSTEQAASPASPSSGGDVPKPGGCSIMVVTAEGNRNITGAMNETIIFTPHELWATNVLDITGMLPDANGEYKLSFHFTKNHKIDFIGIDTTPEVQKEIDMLSPVLAQSGSEDVSSKLADIDSVYAVMNRGDEILLHFAEKPAAGSAMKRAFVFLSKGYYIPE
jgi:hypothetical protein